jgi:hypothetical protein
MMGRARAARRNEAGAIAIVVAICSVILFVLAALVVDLGLARDVRRQSQNASDASALAAANALYPTGNACHLLNPSGTMTSPCIADAVQAAKDYADVNFDVPSASWATCADPHHLAVRSVGSACISFDSASTPTTTRVLMPARQVDTPFGSLAGTSHVEIGSSAEVGVSAATNYKCALCFLNTVDAGNADFTVTGGGIQVNGDLTIGSTAYWTASTIGATGTASGNHFAPAVTKTSSFTDPLAGLTMPTLTGTNRGNVNNCNTTIQPGVYGTLGINNNSTCTLAAGMYVITGRWLLGNNSVLKSATGAGVTLYFVCGTSAAPVVCPANTVSGGGWLDGKNGTVTLTSGAAGFTDYVILYDRNNPNDLSLQGNGGTSITGGVYVKRGSLDFNGNSCFGFSKGPVIAGGVIKANGTKSCVNVINAVDVISGSQPGAIALSK